MMKNICDVTDKCEEARVGIALNTSDTLPIKADDIGLKSLNTSTREISAEQTLARIEPVLSRFGIQDPIDVSLAGVPSCPVFQIVRKDARSVFFNAGKGFTRVESMVSGLMEAIEVHCFERADPSLISGSDLLNSGNCDMQFISHLDLREYNPLPEIKFARDCPDPLVCGTDHFQNREIYLPAASIFRELSDGQITEASPTGIASGNSIPEALCHAICEALERHALAGFYRQGKAWNNALYQQLERVLPPSDADKIHRCLHELTEKDISAEFIFISSEAGVAVFICFLDIPICASKRGAVQGYGAHPDPKIAMHRALGEAIQILALCPPVPVEGENEIIRENRVVMTSKQSAEIDLREVQSQRIDDHANLLRLRNMLEPIDFEYMSIHSDGYEPMDNLHAVTGKNETAIRSLHKLLEGLAKAGHGQVYSCVISPPSMPVVVVKCFCPSLDCIAGL